MPREADLSNVERAFILEALSQNVRLDGRARDQFRHLDISFEDDYGTCTVQLGKTRYVLCLCSIAQLLFSQHSESILESQPKSPNLSKIANLMVSSPSQPS